MSAEAIARLRAARPLHDSYDGVVVSDLDLRALLIAHAELEGKHAEALAALRGLAMDLYCTSEPDCGTCRKCAARSVLAKAGRRE